MTLKGFYPVICTTNLAATCDFYMRYLGFAATFESDWYISLRMEQYPQYELAILDPTHPTVPENYQKSVQGLLLNFEVDDVDAVYHRLIQQERLPLERDLVSEAFGQRHFITADPNGVLIDIITVIPPSEAFASQYLQTP